MLDQDDTQSSTMWVLLLMSVITELPSVHLHLLKQHPPEGKRVLMWAITPAQAEPRAEGVLVAMCILQNRTLAKKSGCKSKRGGTYRRQITLGESFLESGIRMGTMPNKHPRGPAKQYCRKKEMEPQSANMEEQLTSDNHLPQGTEKYLMK